MIRKNKIFGYIVVMCLFVISLTGCELNAEEEKTIKNKTDEEIEYLENQIITIVNKYVKREYEKDGDIAWEDVSEDVFKISNTMDTLMLDLSEYEISKEDMLAFRNEVNNLSLAVSNIDEYNLIDKCSYLYSLLPAYLEKYSDDTNKINIMKLKSLVLSSYVAANSGDWESSKNSISLAETKYNEMSNDVEYMKEYSFNLNKIYILLQEVKNAIELNEIELCKIKYLSFIEKIGY